MKKWLGTGVLMLLATAVVQAHEWEDEQVNAVNREAARAVSFPLANVAAALTADEPTTPFRLFLNGDWEYAWCGSPAERPQEFYKPEYDTSNWATIDVPSCVEMRGYGIPIYTNIRYPHQRQPPKIGTEYNPVSSYRTTFTVPQAWEERPVFIRFDGVYSAFYLWLNGMYVGYSEDSKLPAEFNLTKYLKPGENLLAVEVYRWCDGSYLEDQDMFRFSGIYREVSLFSPPNAELRDFFVKTKLSDDFSTAQLELTLKGRALKGQELAAEVQAQLLDAEGILVAQPYVSLELSGDGGDAVAQISTTVARPHLWSAEDPYLYTLVLVLTATDGSVDIRTCKVGFRKIEVHNGQVLYNGKAIKFKGVNRHETTPENGRTVTRAEMLEEILMFKRYNIDTVRTAHYPDHYYWYQLCDRYGIYVVAEANVESHGMGYGDESLSHVPSWEKAHVERNVNHVENYKNHASVVMWSLGNEAGPGDNFKAAATAVRALDTTRLVHYERNSSFCDVDSTMYPTVEWVFERGKNKQKPFFLCEYAHAMGNAMGNFKEYWEAFYSSEALCGGCVWDWIDQAIWRYTGRTTADGQPERYYAYGGDFDDTPNDGNFVVNGIIGPDRKVTPKLIEVKGVHQNLVVSSDNAASGKAELWNRFLFTQADAYAGRWALMQDGVAVASGCWTPPALAPLSRQTIDLPLPRDFVPLAGSEYFYRISFHLKHDTLWASQGHEVAASQLRMDWPASVRRVVTAKPAKLHQLRVSEDDCKISVTGRDFSAVFCRATGTLSALTYAGRTILQDQPGNVHGPRFTPYRAFVDNDLQWGKWLRTDYMESGLSQMSYHASPMQVEQLDATTVRISTTTAANGFKSARFTHQAIYTISGDGAIEVYNKVIPAGKQPPALPRIGTRMQLAGTLENFAYYGRGPWENYVDRCAASEIGYYESTVTAQYVAYVRPQENGNKCEVRWAAFTDKSGRGVLFSFAEPMNVTALHYLSEELDAARHRNGQERIVNFPTPRAEVCLTLDIAHTGLGGGSCGPRPMDKYILKPQVMEYTYTIKPVAKAGHRHFSALAR